MKQAQLIRTLEAAAPEFARHDWLEEAVVFGVALTDDPVDSDVDVLLIARRTPSAREAQEATEKLRPLLESRVRQPLALRITTLHQLESPRGRNVGYGRHLRGQHLSVFRRAHGAQGRPN